MKKLFFFTLFTGIVFLSVVFVLSSKVYQLEKKMFTLEEKIVFYQTLQVSKDFLYAIMNDYKKQKSNIIKVHKYVLNHLNEDFYKLKSKFGQNYNIYLTNKNFVITKTTFKYDKNFSLAFAKDYFLSHKGIKVSSPICEMATTDFISFSDSYQNGKVLQIGYIFNSDKIKEFKEKIKQLKKQNSLIKSVYLYFVYPHINFASKCNFLEPLHRKYSLKEMNKNKEIGFKFFKQLQQKNPIFTKNSMYVLSANPFGDGYMIFKIDINTQPYQNALNTVKYILSFVILFLIIIGSVLFIYFKKVIDVIETFAKHIEDEKVYKYDGEFKKVADSYNKTLQKLHSSIASKKEFLEFVMHELKTPLSILSLNVENEISRVAIKKLNMAYEDMTYFLEFDKTKKYKKKLNLKEFIEYRMLYFDDIVKSEKKIIYLDLEECCIEMNESDLERLIDNNISNAIKYSTTNFIKISLKECVLRFENDGEIKDKEKIFEKFHREDNIKGGFGIGLSIISSIISSYDIKFNLITDMKVVFEYDLRNLKC